MPAFSERSLANLREAHPDLRRLFERVVKTYDCSVIEGHRTEREQEKLFHAKLSKVRFPNSKHNSQPAEAVDVVPYPIPKDWGAKSPRELARFYHFAGYVLAVAEEMGIPIRWGGDWDGDHTFADQSFHDLPHFELLEVSDA